MTRTPRRRRPARPVPAEGPSRIAQIERLKTKVTELKERLAQRDETIAELTPFKELVVSRLAAQC
ncbi:hypothetical protein BV401_03055 [Streptomyces malaysiensis subsp. malaysiensis]|uniref:Transposase n=1 Tax=Streptomyces autolyticus TaxID=75293 RepID=A0ABN4W0J0_9ACTN|nr:hypothetical protein BV401_03055 [Streptomyces autolyticus]